jgi:pimeloyl-ACP methyl ester carboxylesterase
MREATLMEGFESRVTEIAGVRTRYFVGGAGPAVLLIHGLGGAALNWTELAPLLARRRTVVVPDLPGHGQSQPLEHIRDLDALADHVAAVSETEGALPAAVVGNSMGGLVALRLAIRRPDAVHALVLAAAAGIVSATRRAEVALAFTNAVKPGKRVAGLRHIAARRPAVARAIFSYWGADDPASLSPAAVLGFLEGPAHATEIASAARALVRDDPRELLADVRCPALVVWGARDRLVPLDDGFEYARRLRAPLRTIAGAGHLLVGERPEECAEIIETFLDNVRA